MRAPLLPRFVADTDRDQAVLDASRAVLGLYLADGRSDHAVRDLAAHARLSERTFYRYFPRKEDALRPYLQAGLGAVVDHLRRSGAHQPLREALVSAHAELFELALQVDVPALLDVLTGTERQHAVWLRLVEEAEAAFAAVVAERLGLAPDALHARFAGAVIVAAGRVALLGGHPGPPGEVFVTCLDQLGDALWSPPRSAP